MVLPLWDLGLRPARVEDFRFVAYGLGFEFHFLGPIGPQEVLQK